ncbi:MAG: type II toxin-antitoxin system prevent-host-death family antitoxin [Chloroflexi bacterium]|nr:type II toxin-antitoxin system prevent-host-death family antitoxin [Chloroflexota bacterium]
MPIETTYTQARANLATLWDRVTDDREVVIVKRRGAEPIALIAADELSSLMETAHLLKSPKNAERLLEALAHARRGEVASQPVEELAAEVGLDT